MIPYDNCIYVDNSEYQLVINPFTRELILFDVNTEHVFSTQILSRQ